MSSILGQPLDRVDGRAKVTGAGRYAAEWPLERIAHAVLVPATIAHGRLKELDTAAAELAPGVLAVLTHRNAPEMKPTALFNPGGKDSGAAATTVEILHTEEIAWDGQPIALVVAETVEQARHAAELVRAEYEVLPHQTDLAAARLDTFVPEHVMGEKPELKIGDPEGALASALVKIDAEYFTPRENHNPIEPHAAIAHWEGDRLTVYDASQFIYGVRKLLAEKFSVPEEKVRVLSPIVGGAFGCKGLTWPHVPLCVAAAKVVGRPVKLSLPRQHYYRLIGGRTPTEQRVALGADREGKLTSLIHTGITTTSTSNMFTEQFTFPARHLYATPNLLVSQKLVKLDTVPPTFMRAPGETPGTFALESALDELSYATGIDPIELRLRNIGEKDPTTGVPYSIRHAKEMFAVAAGRFGWEKRNPAPRSMRDGRWLIGQGLASPYYPVYQEGTQASVRVFADGTALGTTAAHEMGMGTATVQMQNLAQTLGLPAEKVRFEIGDTRFPFAAVAGGSSQSISIGAAVLAACGELKTKLLAFARKQAGSPFAGVKDEEIELRDGGLFLKGENGRGSSFVEIVRAAGEESVEAQGKSDAGDAPEKHSMGSYGALCCEVAIDEELGTLRVRRIVACYDVGRVLNAKTATSQFRGGIIMGLGMALMEETLLDHRFGRIVNPNLAEYHLPVQADVPEIEVHFLDRPDPFTPMGAHGIGEIGITGVAAAVANAVYHATGQRIRELPITCEKLMA